MEEYKMKNQDADLGLGGYVYGESGIYGDMDLRDKASLCQHSITAVICFGNTGVLSDRKYDANSIDAIRIDD